MVNKSLATWRRAIAVLVGFAATLTIFLVLSDAHEIPEPRHPPQAEPGELDGTAAIRVDGENHVLPSESGLHNTTDLLTPDPNIEEIYLECGDLSAPPSPLCSEKLRQFFWDKPVPYRASPILPEAAQIAFSDIFLDPSDSHEQTITVLRDEKCRLNVGDLNFDLHRHCHGDALINHALFSAYCSQYSRQNTLDYQPTPNDGVSLSGFQRELARATSHDRSDNSRHVPTRNEVLVNHYRRSFVARECMEAPPQTRSRLGYWDPAWQAKLANDRDLYGEGYRSSVDQALERKSGELYHQLEIEYFELEFRELVTLAARLGNEYALINFDVLNDEGSREQIARLRPDLHYLRLIPTAGTVDMRLRLALQARHHAVQHGWDIDPEYLWKKVCVNGVTKQECKDSVHNLEYSGFADDGALKQIEDFETSLYELQF